MELKRKRLLILTVATLLVVGGSVGIVLPAGPTTRPRSPVTPCESERRSPQYTGGGTVTDSELGDEEGYYEVEVTLQDGTEVDVHLDQNFNVIGSDNDKDDGEDTDN